MVKPLTAERLRELLDYDPATGAFHWRVSRGGWGAGREAGRVNGDGYRRIGIDGRQCAAHHLAWLHVTGEWPPMKLDHKDTDRGNNRFANLRPATQSQNVANASLSSRNTSGFKGVSRIRSNGKWGAFVQVNGKNKNLGTFETPEEAHAAYAKAAREVFGEFARAA